MELYYLSPTGTKIDLMGDDIIAEDPESLLDSEWKYTTTSAYARDARLKTVYRESREHSLTVGILADTADEFDSVMEKMESCFEGDVISMSPGKLYWNNYYRSVLVIKRSYEEYYDWCRTVDAKLTFLALNPAWIEETTISVKAASGDSGGLTIPFEIPATLPVTSKNTIFNLNHYAESNFKLVAYGPTTKVSVKIGDNTYEVDHRVESGEYLTIDSRETAPIEKRCYITTADGTTENVFNYRSTEYSIFQKISGGKNQITYSNAYGIDLTIFKERSDPRWI